jgi:hypothetical protein
MELCKYCGGTGELKEGPRIDLGHGYSKSDYRVVCNQCESHTPPVELLDLYYGDERKKNLLKVQSIELWENGKIIRNSKKLDVTITRKEYDRLLYIESNAKRTQSYIKYMERYNNG